jgi:hypothetical protein
MAAATEEALGVMMPVKSPRQRRRKSTAGNVVAIGVAFKPPEPPAELVPEAKETWFLTVGAFKPEWFAVEANLKLLERYCRAIALSHRLHQAIEAADLRGDYKQFSRIHRAVMQQTNLIISLTTKLRLWPTNRDRKRWP